MTEIADRACPVGFERKEIFDANSEFGWQTCAAEGNPERSSGSLRDLPEGAVCGLTDLRETDPALCLGRDTQEEACPPASAGAGYPTSTWTPA